MNQIIRILFNILNSRKQEFYEEKKKIKNLNKLNLNFFLYNFYIFIEKYFKK
jgi:hypothetical protein